MLVELFTHNISPQLLPSFSSLTFPNEGMVLFKDPDAQNQIGLRPCSDSYWLNSWRAMASSLNLSEIQFLFH